MTYNSPYAPTITATAQKYGVDPNLALRVANQESGFNQGSVSNRGAVGLFQLMPGTAQDLGVNPNNANENIDGGIRYLKQMQDRYNGNVPLALAAYNAGPDRVDKYIHNGTALPSETTNYVQSIQGAPMASPNPALASAMPQQQQQDQAPVQQAMMNGGTSPNYGGFSNSLERAGAWLTSIANPAGGAALLNAATLPMFRQRYQVVSTPFGNQLVFDQHRGQFVGGVGSTQPVGSPNSTNNVLNTPVGMKALMEDSNKKMDNLTDSYQKADDLQNLALQALRLSQTPGVHQGAGGEYIGDAKNLIHSISGGYFNPTGNDQTQELEKINSQLQGQYLGMQKGIRFAAPEIKFGEMANADVNKDAPVNQNIYNNIIQQTQRVKDIYGIALRHRATSGVLGPDFDNEVSNYIEKTPTYQDTTVKPGAPAQPNRPPLSQIFQQ